MAFVRVHVDVYCTWEKREPRYRLYVNDELMTERTWRWKDVYLEEMLQLEIGPGEYEVRLELLDTKRASMHFQNLRIVYGSGEVIATNRIRTINEIP